MSASQSRRFVHGSHLYDVRVEAEAGHATLSGTGADDGNKSETISGKFPVSRRGEWIEIRTGGKTVRAAVARDRRGTWVTMHGRVWLLEQPKPSGAGAGAGGAGSDTLVAPMTGRVLKVLVKAGDDVSEGATVAVIEAMKMETKIVAPRAGRVEAVHAEPGAAVEQGAPVVSLEPEA